MITLETLYAQCFKSLILRVGLLKANDSFGETFSTRYPVGNPTILLSSTRNQIWQIAKQRPPHLSFTCQIGQFFFYFYQLYIQSFVNIFFNFTLAQKEHIQVCDCQSEAYVGPWLDLYSGQISIYNQKDTYPLSPRMMTFNRTFFLEAIVQASVWSDLEQNHVMC